MRAFTFDCRALFIVGHNASTVALFDNEDHVRAFLSGFNCALGVVQIPPSSFRVFVLPNHASEWLDISPEHQERVLAQLYDTVAQWQAQHHVN